MLKISIEIEEVDNEKTTIKVFMPNLEDGTLAEKNSCIMINNYLKEFLTKQAGAKKKTTKKSNKK